MGLSIWHLLVVLAIVLVLFGAKRLRNLGGDLGAAIKGFKDAVTDGKKEGEQPVDATAQAHQNAQPAPQQIPPQASTSPYAQQPYAQQPQPTVIVQAAPTAQPTVAPAHTTTHHQG